MAEIVASPQMRPTAVTCCQREAAVIKNHDMFDTNLGPWVAAHAAQCLTADMH
jgi:hypothetical protein